MGYIINGGCFYKIVHLFVIFWNVRYLKNAMLMNWYRQQATPPLLLKAIHRSVCTEQLGPGKWEITLKPIHRADDTPEYHQRPAPNPAFLFDASNGHTQFARHSPLPSRPGER